MTHTLKPKDTNIEEYDIVPPKLVIKSGQAFVKSYGTFFSAYLNENTIENYTRALHRFFVYTEKRGLTLNQVDAQFVMAYAKMIKHQKNQMVRSQKKAQ